MPQPNNQHSLDLYNSHLQRSWSDNNNYRDIYGRLYNLDNPIAFLSNLQKIKVKIIGRGNIVKDEKEYGARPIMRAIQDTIEDKITDALLAMDYENGHTFNISCTSDLSELAVA